MVLQIFLTYSNRVLAWLPPFRGYPLRKFSFCILYWYEKKIEFLPAKPTWALVQCVLMMLFFSTTIPPHFKLLTRICFHMRHELIISLWVNDMFTFLLLQTKTICATSFNLFLRAYQTTIKTLLILEQKLSRLVQLLLSRSRKLHLFCSTVIRNVEFTPIQRKVIRRDKN